MDRADWDAWRSAKGQKKSKLFVKMTEDNEPLVQTFVAKYRQHTQYYTDSLHEDLLQAARIGLMRAIEAWDPEKGSFSLCAYHWTRHEMQLVVRHATGISIPKSAFMPRAKQDEAARFYALHGREPAPEEIGVKPGVAERARKATASFGTMSEAMELPADIPEPEAHLDRKRDQRALQTFLKKLTAKDRKAFWGGQRPDLEEQAKSYVEKRRVIR